MLMDEIKSEVRRIVPNLTGRHRIPGCSLVTCCYYAIITQQLNCQPNVVRLAEDRYKGQSGKIAVLGGCAEYTSSPYFAAYAGLQVKHKLLVCVTPCCNCDVHNCLAVGRPILQL